MLKLKSRGLTRGGGIEGSSDNPVCHLVNDARYSMALKLL